MTNAADDDAPVMDLTLPGTAKRLADVERECVKLGERIDELEKLLMATRSVIQTIASQAATAVRATKKGGR